MTIEAAAVIPPLGGPPLPTVRVASAKTAAFGTLVAATGAITVTAPPAVAGTTPQGEFFAVGDDAGTAVASHITVSGGANQIDGAATYVIALANQIAMFVWNGANWNRVIFKRPIDAPGTLDSVERATDTTQAVGGGGGGGTTPSGTGIPHIVAGVQNAAASLIVNADVDPAAAIDGTKVDPNFGAQNITTTGGAALAYGSYATVAATTGFMRGGYDAALVVPYVTTVDNLGVDKSIIEVGPSVAYRLGNADFTGRVEAFDLHLISRSAGDCSHAGFTFVDLASGTNQLHFGNGAGLPAEFGVPVAIGAAPAATGALRLTNNEAIRSDNGAGTGDVEIVVVDAALQMRFGQTVTATVPAGYVFHNASNFGAYTAFYHFYVTSTAFNMGVPLYCGRPIAGDAAQASPWGVHGSAPVDQLDANYVLSAAEYSQNCIESLGTALTGTRQLRFPSPTTDAEIYEKTVWNNTPVGVGVVRCTTGVGTSVDVANGQICRIRVWAGGVRRVSAPTT